MNKKKPYITDDYADFIKRVNDTHKDNDEEDDDYLDFDCIFEDD